MSVAARRSSSPLRRVLPRTALPLSVVLATALGAGLVPPAAAAEPDPDPGLVAARAFLTEVAAWSENLGSVGRLAEPVPVVGDSIGSVIGMTDLLDEVLAAVPADADTVTELTDAFGTAKELPFDDGAGRSGTVTVKAVAASAGQDARLELRAEVDVDPQDTGFELVSETPRLSLASPSGLQIGAAVTLALTVGIEQVGAAYHPYLVSGPLGEGGFGLSAAAEVTLPDGTPASAALGVLEVDVTEDVPGETLPDVRVAAATSLEDPDGDGRLRFTEPGGGAGELSAADGIAALATVGAPAGQPAGSVDLDLAVTADADGSFDLPGVDATVSVTWADVAVGAPQVQATGLSGLDGFLAVSPRDLADMLAQAATALTAATLNQPANLDLPFLSGSLSDAAKASELLVAFLEENVQQPVLGADGQPLPVQPDPSGIGRPDFASLQQLVALLEGFDADGTLGDASVEVVVGDLAADRLPLTLSMSREEAAPVDLVPPTPGSTGAGTYGTESTLGVGTVTTAVGAPFTAETVGRRVVAGGSAGTVQQVSGDGSAAVLTAPWTGGEPADGTTFVIEGAAPQAGVIELGDLLGTGGPDGPALRGANGITPTATVTPDYDVELRLALDLQAPRTGAACSDGPADAPCPYTRTNADGSSTVVVEEPVAVERLLFATGYRLLSADVPVEAGVDVASKAGFLKVDVTGDVVVGRGAADAPMLTVDLAAVPSAPGGWVRTTDFFELLADPASGLLGGSTNISAGVTGAVTVPDADAFLPVGATAGFSATWAEVGTGEPVVEVSDLSEVLAFDIDPENPAALLGMVVKALELLDEQLQAQDGTGVLGTQVPLVDTSLAELLGSELGGGGPDVTFTTQEGADTVVGEPDADGDPTLVDLPVDKVVLTDASRSGEDRAFGDELVGRAVMVGTQVGVVQEVLDADSLVIGQAVALTDSLGMPALYSGTLASVPADGTGYSLRSELADAVSLVVADPPDSLQELVALLDARLGEDSPVSFRADQVGTDPALVLGLDWTKDYSTSTPVTLDLGLADLVSATASARAELSVEAGLQLDVALPLTAAAVASVDLRVLDTSRADVRLDASLAGDVEASLGPLSLALGNPDTDVDAVAEARYSLGFGAPATPEPAGRSLTAFLADAALAVNAYDGGVSCGETAGGTDDDLALCADLPLFVSADGETWTETFQPISVRLPKGGGGTADLAALVALTGTVSADDTRLRLDAPSEADLEAAFLEALLDFGLLGEGIDAFLALVEDALAEASLDGKLPVVGEDLQAGADVIGDVRSGVAEVFDAVESVNGGKIPDVEGVQDLLLGPLNTLFVDELGADPGSFVFELTCRLAAADVTGAARQGDGSGTTVLTYAVQAIGQLGGTAVRTAVGETADVADVAVLGEAADQNTVAVGWDAVPNAVEGYAVLRSEDAGTTWTEVEVVPATTTSLVDSGQTTDEPVTVPEEPANVDACDGVQLPDVQGVLFRVDIGDGTVTAENGCEGEGCIQASVPLDVGVPGLAVRPQKDGQGGALVARLGWQAHLAFELDRTHGLSLLTQDTTTAEFGLGFAVDLEEGIRAELAFLKVDVTKGEGATAPAIAGAVQVDLAAPDADACYGDADAEACQVDGNQRLGLGDLLTQAGEVVRPHLVFALDVNWQLKALVDAALPGIQTTLLMQWSVEGTEPSDITPSGLFIKFDEIMLDAGGFLSGVLGPIVAELKRVTGPLQPVVDTLYAPIPVLSDLSKLVGGDDITLVTLAKTFSTLKGGPKLDFVDTVAAVITFVNNLPTGESVLIPIGSFEVTGDAAFTSALTPDRAESLVSGPVTKKDIRQAIDSRSTQPDGKGGTRPSTALSKTATGPSAAGAGIEIPVLDDPTLLFTLIMGGDIDLVTFDSGELSLAFTWRQSFGPVYAPPPVLITLSGSARVTAQIQAGFDTYGLRKAFEQELSAGSVAGILNGLYFRSTDDDGNPLPVVAFYGEIAAGASVSVVVLEVGIQGGVSLTIAFSWNDPDKDGKFRLFEFGQAALNNPICLFQVSGRIGIFLKLFVTVGISPFSVSFDLTLADITLLDFSVAPDCSPPPPRLAVRSGDGATLVLLAGGFGSGDDRGDDVYDNTGTAERVVVTAVHDYDVDPPVFRGVRVAALGITEEWLDDDGEKISRVVFDGRGWDGGEGGGIELTFLGDGEAVTDPAPGTVDTSEFDLDTVVIGSSAADVVKTGTGSTWVDGMAGDDVITTSDATGETARVAGGPGADSITAGSGAFVVAGDSTLAPAAGFGDVDLPGGALARNEDDTPEPRGLVDVVDWTTLVAPRPAETGEGSGGAQGSDRVSVGRGGGEMFGGGGDDALAVATDDPRATATGPAALRAAPVTVVAGTGTDAVKGGGGADTVWTGPRTAATRAVLDGPHGVDTDGAGDGTGVQNAVETGGGADTVYGSAVADFVTVTPSVGYGPGLPAAHVRLGGGDDAVTGGLGADQLFGGPGSDWVVAGPATVSGVTGTDDFGVTRDLERLPLPAGVTAQGNLLVGGDGPDRVVGGDASSTLFGDRYEFSVAAGAYTSVGCGDVVLAPVSAAPAEPGAGTPGRDEVLGGAGADRVSAGDLADRVRTAVGDDLACGQGGNDDIDTGTGADTAWAGSGADLVRGGADADRLFGNLGQDRLYGDDGADTVEGDEDGDQLWGGDGADLLVGGHRAAGLPDGSDTVFGGPGRDVVVGDDAAPVADGQRGPTWYPSDLAGLVPTAGAADALSGGEDHDEVYGGLGDDDVRGDADDDALEGNSGADRVRGGTGEDVLVGGSRELSAPGAGRPDTGDDLAGEAGPDLLLGDDARVTEKGAAGAAGETPELAGRGFARAYALVRLDLGTAPAAGTSGEDRLDGGDAADALFGQGADDALLGEAGDDLLEGGQADDALSGGTADDDLVGGSSVPLGTASGGYPSGQPDGADDVLGGAGEDLVLGDDGSLRRGAGAHPLVVGRLATARQITVLDLGDAPAAGTSGDDVVDTGGDDDLVLAQAGADHVRTGGADDYAEGGPGSDLLRGGTDDDDLVGGSYTAMGGAGATRGQPDAGDLVRGGTGDDLVLGDNGSVLRGGAGYATDRLLQRLGSDGQALTGRTVARYDLLGAGQAPQAGRSGADTVAGGDGVDVGWGQSGADLLSGGGDDDALLGGGGDDVLRGDASPEAATGGRFAPAPAWPAWRDLGGVADLVAARGEDSVGGAAAADGDDDLVGGSGLRAAADGADRVEGGGGDDVVLADNGQVVRTLVAGGTAERTMAERAPQKATVQRVPDPTVGLVAGEASRFCTDDRARGTCEAAGAWGGDTVWGDAGDDQLWAQDGVDTVEAGTGDDEAYGETGADRLAGDAGRDVLLGDRGGVLSRVAVAAGPVATLSGVPQESYRAVPAGSYDRRVDHHNDVVAGAFVGAPAATTIPLPGDQVGGADRIRGGADDDVVFAGTGDDMANGDGGGDDVFGDDGADVLWGGAGCTAGSAGCTDAAARGEGDRYVDRVFGGAGGAVTNGFLGADVIDWLPRGTYPGGCSAAAFPTDVGSGSTATSTDPCAWFEMTGRTGVAGEEQYTNQHHQGTDWVYGGWDRDVMQADVAANGPNPGDRLLDWNGAFNLYSHCNAAYGGFNDVRQHSPGMVTFLQVLAYGSGAGQGPADAAASTTSAYRSVRVTYTGDTKDHAAGQAFPGTPGHFDSPQACSAG